MFLTTFNKTKECRNPIEVKAEMCANLLKLFKPLDEDEVKEVIQGTFQGMSELLRLHGNAVKKIHVLIINNSFKDSFEAWKGSPKNGFHTKTADPLSLTDRIFALIAEICKINTQSYFRADFEFAVTYLAEIMALLEKHTHITFEVIE